MGIEVGIAAIGLAIAGAGATTQYMAGQKAKSAQEEQMRIQQQQEALRKRQLALDNMRKQREIIRAGLRARSMALATSVAQGAGTGGSGLAGGYGQIAGRTNTNLVGQATNASFGNQMFDLNAQMAGAMRNSAAAGTDAAMGSAMTSLGGTIMNNAGSIARVGGYGQTAGGGGYYQGSTFVPVYGNR
jgi:hypothetical protein